MQFKGSSRKWLPPGGGSAEGGGGAIGRETLDKRYLRNRPNEKDNALSFLSSRAPSVFLLRKNPPPSRREAKKRP